MLGTVAELKENKNEFSHSNKYFFIFLHWRNQTFVLVRLNKHILILSIESFLFRLIWQLELSYDQKLWVITG